MVKILFDDIFTVTQLDPDGKKFDKVLRVETVCQQFDMQMQLDVNSEIYPLNVGEKFTMVLALTQNLDGTPDTRYFMQVRKVFPYPITITTLQFAVGTIFTLLMWVTSIYKLPKISYTQVFGKNSELKTTIDVGLIHRDNILKNIGHQFE